MSSRSSSISSNVSISSSENSHTSSLGVLTDEVASLASDAIRITARVTRVDSIADVKSITGKIKHLLPGTKYTFCNTYMGAFDPIEKTHVVVTTSFDKLWETAEAQATKALGEQPKILTINLTREEIYYYDEANKRSILTLNDDLKALIKDAKAQVKTHLGFTIADPYFRSADPAGSHRHLWANNTFMASPYFKDPTKYLSEAYAGKVTEGWKPEKKQAAFRNVCAGLRFIHEFKKILNKKIRELGNQNSRTPTEEEDLQKLEHLLSMLSKENLDLDAIYVALTIWRDTPVSADEETQKQLAAEATKAMSAILEQRLNLKPELKYPISIYSHDTGHLLLSTKEHIEEQIEKEKIRVATDAPSMAHFVVQNVIHLEENNDTDDQIKKLIERIGHDLSDPVKNSLNHGILGLRKNDILVKDLPTPTEDNWDELQTNHSAFIDKCNPAKETSSDQFQYMLSSIGTSTLAKVKYVALAILL